MKNYIVYILIISILILAPMGRILAENGEEALEQSQQEVSGTWDKIKDFSQKAADAIFGFFKKIWQGIGESWKNHISPWLENFWSTLKTEFKKEMDEMGQDTSGFFKDRWNNLLEWLKLKKSTPNN